MVAGSDPPVPGLEGAAPAGGAAQRPPARSPLGRAARFPATAPPGLGGLRGLYERYCDHEARELLRLVPREGLRSLYAGARDWAEAEAALEAGSGGEVPDGAIPPDALALVVRYARELLPLPPYQVWLTAYLEDRAPFLAAMGIESTPNRPEPVLVDVRPVEGGWMAGLHLFQRNGDWRGFLHFTREAGSPGHRTAEIFRGEAPAVVRARFRQYSAGTLQAFLRSVLP